MHNYDVDLFVIGAGSGGVRAARIAAGYGVRVAIAEKQFYGGTCVNIGCVPKKIMTYVASYASHFKDSRGYGWKGGEQKLDWTHFIEAKNTEINRLNGIYERMLQNAGVRMHWGAAEIINEHSVQVNDQIITAERILIATGGQAEIPDIPGAKEFGITSDDIFYLPVLPKKLLIMGVGYIGLEFAGIFNALGTEVHVIYRRNTILNAGFDQDVRTFLYTEMLKQGIQFHPETTVKSVEKTAHGICTILHDDTRLEADHILFATGRKPNISGLGLEKLGIALRDNDAVIVNEEEQTNIPSIYAVGDVTDRVALTPVALAEGHMLVDRLYGGKERYPSYRNIPSAVFSNPNVAQVGLTEADARAQYPDDIDIYKSEFRAMRMILAQRDERTLMKLIIQRSTDRVLGVHMVGQDAGEIIQGFATALIAGATKKDFDLTIGIHPTSAEEFVTMRTKTG